MTEFNASGAHCGAYDVQREETICRASQGDTSAIVAIGRLAHDRLLEQDVTVLSRVFMHTVHITASQGSAAEQSDDAVTPAMLAALRSVLHLFRRAEFWRSALHATFYDALEIPLLWEWARNTLVRCLDHPQCHSGVIHAIDNLFGSVAYRGQRLWPDEKNDEVSRVFARVWLSDIERGDTSITLGILVRQDVCSFDQVVRGTVERMAKLCLEHFRLVHRQHSTTDAPLVRIVTVIDGLVALVYDLLEYLHLGIFDLAIQGAAFVFTQCMGNLLELLERDVSGVRGLAPPQAVTVVSKLMDLTSKVLNCSPDCVVHAIAAGLLPVISRISTTLPPQGALRSGDIGDIEEDFRLLYMAIDACLATISQHVFHHRVYRQLAKATRSRVDSDAILSEGPLGTSWKRLMDNLVCASRVADSFNKVHRMERCDNYHCSINQGNDAPQVHDCPKCFSTGYCSIACREAHWPAHRENCENIAHCISECPEQALLQRRPQDVILFYEHAVKCFVEDLDTEFVSLFRQHPQELRGTPPFYQPLLVLKVERDVLPVSLAVEPTIDHLSDHQLLSKLHYISQDKDEDVIVAYAQFPFADEPITIATMITNFDIDTGEFYDE